MSSLRARLTALAAQLDGARSRPTLVLEWTDPPFSAGHWVPDVVVAAGGADMLGRPGQRSETVTWDRVQSSGAEVVVVAPCGYRFDGAHVAEDLSGAGGIPSGSEVWAVDADAYVVRPGPRVVKGCEMLAAVLHPDRCGQPDPAMARRVN